jgi:hypothetical protein
MKTISSKKALSNAKNQKVKKDVTKFAANILHMPSTINASVSECYGKSLLPELELLPLVVQFKESITAVQDGSMKDMEAMLVAQAYALQTMFVSVARRAHGQEHLKQYATQMNLALKAQAQCRATVQALIELKYPRQVIITEQANIAHHQQVNNGTKVGIASHAHVRKKQTCQNELLEQMDSEGLESNFRQDVPCNNADIVK